MVSRLVGVHALDRFEEVGRGGVGHVAVGEGEDELAAGVRQGRRDGLVGAGVDQRDGRAAGDIRHAGQRGALGEGHAASEGRGRLADGTALDRPQPRLVEGGKAARKAATDHRDGGEESQGETQLAHQGAPMVARWIPRREFRGSRASGSGWQGAFRSPRRCRWSSTPPLGW
ncbi:hypothetical protein D3C86_1645060 [compost metagenome]